MGPAGVPSVAPALGVATPRFTASSAAAARVLRVGIVVVAVECGVAAGGGGGGRGVALLDARSVGGRAEAVVVVVAVESAVIPADSDGVVCVGAVAALADDSPRLPTERVTGIFSSSAYPGSMDQCAGHPSTCPALGWFSSL